MADEIITGFGRTGRWFGVEHHDAVPDVITFGKGIGGGVVPLSGMVATSGIRDVVGTAPNGFSYGHTFSGYPLGCAVGCAVIDTIEQEGLVEEADRKGKRIRVELEQMASRHPPMHGLRGRGNATSLRRAASSLTAKMEWISTGEQPDTWIAFCRAARRRTYRYKRRPSTRR